MTLSLWLVPIEGNPFTKEVEELIESTIPSNFSQSVKKQPFAPHVTLTSDIDPDKTYKSSSQSPQEWLDALSLPAFRKEHDEVIVELDHVTTGDTYHRKLAVEVNPHPNLTKIAAACRRQALGGAIDDSAAQKWAETEFAPHLSLMYADLPAKDVQNKLALIELQIGYSLGSLFACCGGTFQVGGSLVLVDTGKPVAEWEPIARRDTPWVNWRMSRNLS